MPSRSPSSTAEMPQSSVAQPNSSAPKPHGTGFLDGAIFAFLCLFAILLPHSIKGAQHSWQLALLLWLVKLVVDKSRPVRQPLSAPLLAYIVFSAISTFLSPDPNLSWDRMKIACLLLVGIVVA